jgi:ATP-dependent Clp protease ATP-binding subunit ClpX
LAGKGNEIKVRCSFCGKSEDQVRKMIAGPNGAFICDECIAICSEIVDEELAPSPMAGTEINLLKPVEIKNFLMSMLLGRTKLKRCYL